MPPKKTPNHVAAKLLKNPAHGLEKGSGSMSMYAAGLAAVHKERYLQKMSLIGNLDPYLIRMAKHELPETVTYESIIDYALHTKSAYTGENFHCFKAMESRRRFESGMVKSVEGVKVAQKHVVRGKVMHSMSLSEPCLTPWVILEDNEVFCAHCDCVAGIGEICSHVGALLYHLVSLNHDASSKKCASGTVSEQVAVTDREQKWGRPNTSITDNLQQQLQAMDFGYTRDTVDESYGNVSSLGVDDLRVFLNGLQNDEMQCTVMQELCCNKQTCFRCRDKELDPFYSSNGLLLYELYDEMNEGKNIEQLRFMALSIYDKHVEQMNTEACTRIEFDTRQQWKSDMWKLLRTGRITASVLKRVISTRVEEPSISLLKQICYPDSTYFSTQATRYGKKMEKVAFHQLATYLEKVHNQASVVETGLIIDVKRPELAASPDGILHCACCGKVPIEIKCPFKFKDENDVILKLTQKRNPYLICRGQEFEMVPNHDYFAQVQMQIALTEAEYGYFYVWTKHEDMLIEVKKDIDYWNQAQLKTIIFFKAVILPELLGKYYTKSQSNKG